MHPSRAFGLCFASLILTSVACGSSNAPAPPPSSGTTEPPLGRGGRILAIDVNEASDGDYDSAFRLARQVGAQAVSLSLPWDSIETAPGEFHPEPDYLAIANLYYPANATPLALMIGPIDTNIRRVPSDLTQHAFDGPRLVERFNQLLAYAFAKLPETDLTVLAIGNEVDVYLGDDSPSCAAYERFFEATSAFARSLRPGLLVGAKATTSGLLGSSRKCMQRINQHSDVILATYYPLRADGSVHDPSVVSEDFSALASLASPKPVYLLEVGYPSSVRLGSSDEQQARFIREVFRAWDAHAEQIPLVTFTWLHDLSVERVDGYLDYYGLRTRNFAAFLGTLGLRSPDGRDKPAFVALRQEASARGW